MELDSFERKLKELYQSYPEEMSAETSPECLNRLWDRLYAHLDEDFPLPEHSAASEDDFFAPEEDVVIFRCRRYLPPIRYTHSFFELIYVAEGICVNRVEMDSIRLEAGDICILAPGIAHSVHCPEDVSVVYSILVRSSTFETTFFSVISDRDVLSRFFSKALHSKPDRAYIIFHTGVDAQIQTFVGFLNQEYLGNDDYKNRMMVNILHGFIILLLRHHNQHVIIPEESPLPGEDELFTILNYIQSNYANLTIEQLAFHFGFSSRHVARLVKKGAGISFSKLIRATKLQRAAMLLDTSDLSIDEIAHQVGYADLSGFYRAFKRFYGTAPVEYRQREKEPQQER